MRAKRHWCEGSMTNLDGRPAASHFSQCAVTAGSMAPFSSIEVKPGRSG